MRYQQTFAWISLIGFAIGAAIALTGCLGARYGGWDVALGFQILRPGLAVGAVALAAGLTWVARALWYNTSSGGRIGAAGLIGSALLIGIPAHFYWLEVTEPPIHDISSDIGEPPQFHDLLRLRAGAPNPPDYDGPNLVVVDGKRIPVSLAQRYAYVDIKPLEQLASDHPQPEMVKKYFWRSLNAIYALGWDVVGFDLKSGRIEAVSRSFWFGTASDIVIRVRPTGAIGVRVDVRAKSRFGEGDGGRNAELVRAFLKKVKVG